MSHRTDTPTMEEAFISYSDQDGKDNEHYSQNESDDLMEDAEETEETEEEISGSEVGDKPEDEEYDKFEPFLRLPAEIRCKIWKHASYAQRNVLVWARVWRAIENDALGFRASTSAFNVFKFVSSTRPPALLSVSKESRKEGLKYYKLDFGCNRTIIVDEESGFELKVSLPPTIYINWEADRLCLPPHLNLIPGLVQNELGGSGVGAAEYLVKLCQNNSARFVALGIDTSMGLYPILANQAIWKISSMVPTLQEFILFEVKKNNLKTAIQERWKPEFRHRVPQHVASRNDIRLRMKEENLESMVLEVLHYHGHFQSEFRPKGWDVKPVRLGMEALLNWLKVMSLKNVCFTDGDGQVKLLGL